MTDTKKLLFGIGVIGAIIALYFNVNVPELKESSDIYFKVILLSLIVFMVVNSTFKGRFKL